MIGSIRFKKPCIPVNELFKGYLKSVGRLVKFPVVYEDLLSFVNYVSIVTEEGVDTLWLRVAYSQWDQKRIEQSLLEAYNILTTDGKRSVSKSLIVDSIDFCEYANSKPFRIKVKNILNENYEFFYVKKADLSRIVGLELEQYLSYNQMNFLTDGDTLMEYHIVGIPGDAFIKEHLENPLYNKVRIAKEYVKFNERCFWRLLGDMRAYNFSMVVIQDFDGIQFKIFPVDFDQQSYHGDIEFYKPASFSENKSYNEIVEQCLKPSTIAQYRNEERGLLAKRIKSSYPIIKKMFTALSDSQLSTTNNISKLSIDVSKITRMKDIQSVTTMTRLLEKLFMYLYSRY